jgi:hypothetical protein
MAAKPKRPNYSTTRYSKSHSQWDTPELKGIRSSERWFLQFYGSQVVANSLAQFWQPVRVLVSA